MLISIGNDIGTKNGAIAIINSELDILKLIKAPYFEETTSKENNALKLNKVTGKYEKTYRKRTWTDYKKFRDIFIDYINDDIIYTLEKVFVRPKEGEVNSFIFGNSLGINQGLYAFLNPIQYYSPTPNEWKREFKVSSDKGSSIDLANVIFEKSLKNNNITLSKDKQKINKDDDLAEALLLAFYGMIKYTNN